MDKWLLVAINAKYSHTSLSVRSICTYVKSKGFDNISFIERTINDEYFSILNEILTSKPTVLGFSCYIWNIELVKSLVKDIKSVNADIMVFLGGPEVSYNKDIFNELPEADFVIKGEGEIPVLKLIKGQQNIKGVWYPDAYTDFAETEDMDNIPFCYSEEELSSLTNRAVYYETSRGCPFKCAFCISSLTKGVRVLSLERVFKEIDIFINSEIKRVKLVDRTFNFDRERAKKIIRYIIDNSKNTCFHFEIGADLLDDELIELIKEADYDVIQFEAGIQSTNEKSLELCDRKTDMNKLCDNLRALINAKIRIHLDLIAGLPEEDYESFKNSFDEVYKLQPKVLQVGFLKLLHGSKLRNKQEKYDYKFRSKAPYEVLSNKFILFDELMEIKKVDKSVDCYLNSGIFVNSLKFIFEKNAHSPFDFYHKLGDDMGDKKLSVKDKFELLLKVYRNIFGNASEFLEYLKLDYVLKERGALPTFFNNFKTKEEVSRINEFIKSENLCELFPQYKDMKYKDYIKHIDFEIFKFENQQVTYLFDRKNNEHKCI